MNFPVIIALDFSTKEETFQFLNKFKSEQLFVKSWNGTFLSRRTIDCIRDKGNGT